MLKKPEQKQKLYTCTCQYCDTMKLDLDLKVSLTSIEKKSSKLKSQHFKHGAAPWLA
jgi:hypothetical protein